MHAEKAFIWFAQGLVAAASAGAAAGAASWPPPPPMTAPTV